jgi:hypothetical protein
MSIVKESLPCTKIRSNWDCRITGYLPSLSTAVQNRTAPRDLFDHFEIQINILKFELARISK